MNAPAKPNASTSRSLTIDHIGARGDGRAKEDGAWVSVAFTLPGEVVEVSGEGERLTLLRLVAASTQRAEPPCRYFGRCGGCSLQHLAAGPYAALKRDLIVRALSARGLEADVAAAWITPAASRRRASFAARRQGKAVLLGFHARRSHELIGLEECPVVRPAMVAAFALLKTICDALLTGKETLSLLVTETESGLDLAVSGVAKEAPQLARAEAAAMGLRSGLARVGIEGGDVLTERRPAISVGAARLLPPAGGFLQASAEAEAEMARLVLAHLDAAGPVADLFSGCGTFALRLAQRQAVHAVDGDRAAIEALGSAARATPGLKPLTAERRDLFRNPLAPSELARFGGLVLDPPRAGAAAQVAEIARTGVARAAYVSCDPATLARDLRTLVDGGYRIIRIHPVDQFLWSAHVEAVALLEKAA